MRNDCRNIADKLKNIGGQLESMTVTVGFDGFVDEITRVVKNRVDADNYAVFETITEFSVNIRNAAGKSADMEIIREDIKLGGNAPIMANALASLGVNTTCIGAMGYPSFNQVFGQMAPKCKNMSICDPGYTYAFEYNDGKLMFANLKPLEDLTWDRVKEFIGLDRIIDIFRSCDLIALVNWSIAFNVGTIWQGIREEVLPHMRDSGYPMPKVFFDLADPSKRLKKDIQDVLQLIGEYSEFCDVTLGLNKNEAERVYKALNNGDGCSCEIESGFDNGIFIEDICIGIYQNLSIDTLLVHPVDCCIAVNKNGIRKRTGRVVESPKLTTGGGDNFNAGYCLGQLLGFDVEDSMIIGMATSATYVQNGYSPSMDELISYLDCMEKI
jgi:hypothetical protein